MSFFRHHDVQLSVYRSQSVRPCFSFNQLSQYHEENIFSIAAADYAYTNRYASYVECTNPCTSMDVFTNQVYKYTAREDGQIAVTFSKEIDVIVETLTRTFVQFGKLLKLIHNFWSSMVIYDPSHGYNMMI